MSTNNTVSAADLECYDGTNIPRVDTVKCTLQDIKLNMSEASLNRRRLVESMSLQGEPVQFTDRFGNSLAGLLGQSNSIYRLFEPEEVVERAISRGMKADVRVSLVTGKNGVRQVLAATNPKSVILNVREYVDTLRENGVDMAHVGYNNGSIVSFHEPCMPQDFIITGDAFASAFAIDCPLDGYGSPGAYLACIREACKNGAVLWTPAFKTSIQMGKGEDSDPIPTLERFMQAFNSEEGFSAMADRFDAASNSWASVDEYAGLLDLLDEDAIDQSLCDRRLQDFVGPDMMEDAKGAFRIKRRLAELAGQINETYGIVNLDQVPPKVRRRIPTKLSLYDLINFGTEVATHFGTEYGRRAINKFIGSMMADQGGYDLECTRQNNEQPQDLFLAASGTTEVDEAMEEMTIEG